MHLDLPPVFWDPGSPPQDLTCNWLSVISLTKDWLKLPLPEQFLELFNIKFQYAEEKKKIKNPKKPKQNSKNIRKSHQQQHLWCKIWVPSPFRCVGRVFTITEYSIFLSHVVQKWDLPPSYSKNCKYIPEFDKTSKENSQKILDRAGRERGKMLAWPGTGQDPWPTLLARGIIESLKLENTTKIIESSS